MVDAGGSPSRAAVTIALDPLRLCGS